MEVHKDNKLLNAPLKGQFTHIIKKTTDFLTQL